MHRLPIPKNYRKTDGQHSKLSLRSSGFQVRAVEQVQSVQQSKTGKLFGLRKMRSLRRVFFLGDISGTG